MARPRRLRCQLPLSTFHRIRIHPGAPSGPSAVPPAHHFAPAAALALTESEVALLADEKAWTRGSNHGKLGFTVSYLPRSRLQSWQTHVEGRMGILELTLGAAAGNEAFHVALPPEHIPKVREVLASVHWPRPGDSLDVRPPG